MAQEGARCQRGFEQPAKLGAGGCVGTAEKAVRGGGGQRRKEGWKVVCLERPALYKVTSAVTVELEERLLSQGPGASQAARVPRRTLSQALHPREPPLSFSRIIHCATLNPRKRPQGNNEVSLPLRSDFSLGSNSRISGYRPGPARRGPSSPPPDPQQQDPV